jgi:PAS domain S-box-containing protein
MSATETILIVDDHLDNLKVISNLLKPYYRIHIATGGSEALELLHTRLYPDLILLDVMMPDIDGYTICEKIKADPDTCNIPVIFLTAKTSIEDETRGFQVGAVDYITKPINPPVLHARVKAHLALAIRQQQSDIALRYSRHCLAESRQQEQHHQQQISRLGQEIARRKNAEGELLEIKARFLRFTNSLKDKLVFFTHAPDGTLHYLSAGFEAFGLGAIHQALGQSWRNIVDWLPGCIDLAQHEQQSLIDGIKTWTEFEMAYRHSDGQVHYLFVQEYLVRDQDREDIIIEGVALDMTQYKQQEVRLRTLAHAIEQAPTSIVITDHEGAIIYVNPYFCHITGYSAEEALGQNPRLLKSGEQGSAIYESMWNTITHNNTWRGELVNKSKDGRLFWESVAISPICDENGDIVNYIAIKENIDHSKELERIKDDVDLIMRHDLKTPLNAIIGLPQLLELDDNLTEEQREIIQLIRETGQSMLDMIELSLDLFKMETKRYHYHPEQINVLAVLGRIVKLAQIRLAEKQLSCPIYIDDHQAQDHDVVYVAAEERLLTSLLNNLLQNAIEASPCQDTIIIEVQRAAAPILSIRNTGTVPVTIRENFFEKYQTYGKKGGTGLGTYSAKLMADTMGYDIMMTTSDQACSTCVTLTCHNRHS